MPVTHDQIDNFLNNMGFNNHDVTERGFFVTVFKTRRYMDNKGSNKVAIALHPMEDGNYVRAIVPDCYYCKVMNHANVLVAACMAVSRRSRMVQFYLDRNDGELVASIDLPVFDSQLTEVQVRVLIEALVVTLDHFDPVFRAAIERGQLLSTEGVENPWEQQEKQNNPEVNSSDLCRSQSVSADDKCGSEDDPQNPLH